ncbi:unnamed protein product [Phytophthora lilii]|uniref:Unnamed protein product n=1 Tax=Phytophthora lilii TaxID=2077276 RepID=A0A9W6XDW8_9STRA|nr:unnamed protein product [Phytophthora lilii]
MESADGTQVPGSEGCAWFEPVPEPRQPSEVPPAADGTNEGPTTQTFGNAPAAHATFTAPAGPLPQTGPVPPVRPGVQHQVHAAAVNVIYQHARDSEALVLPEKCTLRYQLLPQHCPPTLKDTIDHAQRFEDAREQLRGKPSSVSGLPKPNRKDNRYQQVKGRNSDAKAQNPPKPITTLGGEIPCLGDIVGVDGVKIDPAKAAAIRDWPVPKTKRELQSFIGTCVYVSRFCAGFADHIALLTEVVKNKLPKDLISFMKQQKAAFESLKVKLSSTPILAHADFTKDFYVSVDASDFAVGGYIFQYDDDGRERLLRQLTAQEADPDAVTLFAQQAAWLSSTRRAAVVTATTQCLVQLCGTSPQKWIGGHDVFVGLQSTTAFFTFR